MEYKVGDRVWIRSDLETGMDIMFGFTASMACLRGKECIISEVRRIFDDGVIFYKLKEDSIFLHDWYVDMFEDKGVIHSPLAIEVKPDSFKITTENIRCYLYKTEIDISGAIFLVSEIDELIEVLQLAKVKVVELA